MEEPLLQLKGIGKIYVSEGNVAVGIRGVDLSFRRGEFVAVTGKSGSGKSTLLNIISGMDSYEEGELLINGEPTSHYTQKDWESYRQKYISFIFQDYNIIESFTVLQNVELALMPSYPDAKKRRARALSLLRRVGMGKFIHHKGSKLSGGQKQRTVIARALAKDSPIILADEPTGNLDSKTSEDIIRLLREVSEDKLVIVVTHNFEQVEYCATRHIRVFDGAVEVDQTISVPRPVRELPAPAPEKHPVFAALRGGWRLGLVRFGAMPKLTIFLCLLMLITSLSLSVIASSAGSIGDLTEVETMFTHINGRTVIARADGTVMTEDELNAIARQTGAKQAVRYDYLLDQTAWVTLDMTLGYYYSQETAFSYYTDAVTLDGGRAPTANNELVLRVPLSFQTIYGTKDTFVPFMLDNVFPGVTYTVTGIHYEVDNTLMPQLLLTESGYRVATALAFFNNAKSYFSCTVSVAEKYSKTEYALSLTGLTYCFDFDLPAGSYAVTNIAENLTSETAPVAVSLEGKFQSGAKSSYNYWDWDYDTYGTTVTVTGNLDTTKRVTQIPQDILNRAFVNTGESGGYLLILSPETLANFLYDTYFASAYTQASLFYENDKEAAKEAEALYRLGYVAVCSDETVAEEEIDRIGRVVLLCFTVVGWMLSVVFISFFMCLCTSHAMNATRGDIAVMRSMGIPTATIKTSVYMQTLLCLLPAFLITGVACFLLYTTPATNDLFPFLHTSDYILNGGIMLAIALYLSHRYIGKMFGQSVKKTLRGGNKG